jgi:hypothetical protein
LPVDLIVECHIEMGDFGLIHKIRIDRLQRPRIE